MLRHRAGSQCMAPRQGGVSSRPEAAWAHRTGPPELPRKLCCGAAWPAASVAKKGLRADHTVTGSARNVWHCDRSEFVKFEQILLFYPRS